MSINSNSKGKNKMSIKPIIATYDTKTNTISLCRLKDNQYIVTEDQLGVFGKIFKEQEKKQNDKKNNSNSFIVRGNPEYILCSTGTPTINPNEIHCDGEKTCTLTGGVDINPKIEINRTKVSKKIFDDFLKAGNK